MHFLFDLDSTITRREILPFIAEKAECSEKLLKKIRKMTSEAMSGNLPFEDNFRHRVELLKNISLATVQDIVSTIPLNNEIVKFIRNHKDQCSIVTSNVDVWIETLVLKLGVPCYSSKAATSTIIDSESGNSTVNRAATETQFITKIKEIIRKRDVLSNYSETVVAIGDGFNDIELLEKADVGIAFGGIRSVPDSLLAVSDYAVYSEGTLCRLLNDLIRSTCSDSPPDGAQESTNQNPLHSTHQGTLPSTHQIPSLRTSQDKTIVITAAGMGSRLGMGLPKSLLPLNEKPIIIHQLEMLKDQKDIRIVVGYKADAVIKTVLTICRDVTFVFNHNYKTTNTLNSLYLGARYTKGLILSLDGDLLVHPLDLHAFLNLTDECLGVTEPSTEEPVLVSLTREAKGSIDLSATAFSREKGDMEWTGLVQIQQHKIEDNNSYIYHLLEKYLPMKARTIRCCEVDTHEDYQNAIKWVEENITTSAMLCKQSTISD